MGRKLTDEELADPDFRALLVALEKVSKPIVVKREKRNATVSEKSARQPECKSAV